jgi:hypothetical protein
MAEFKVREQDKLRRVDEIFDELRKDGKTNGEIFGTAYEPLKQLARKMLSKKPVDDSMHASRLVSDLWVKVSGRMSSEFDWESGVHFFRTMALAMQHLLVDYGRSKGRRTIVSLDALTENGSEQDINSSASPRNKNLQLEETDRKLLLAVGLKWLEEESETDEVKRKIACRQAEVIRLRGLWGMTMPEIVAVLKTSGEEHCSLETVKNDYIHGKGKILDFIERQEGR